MLTTSVNPMNQWPKVRRVKPGMLRVKGRCVSPGQWMILRVVAALIVALLIASILAAAVAPWLVSITGFFGGNPIGLWLEGMTDFRWWLRDLLINDYPAVGNTIWYSGTSRLDWHLLGLGIVLFWLKPVLRYGVAAGLGLTLSPLIGRRFKVSFTREHVVIHRWFRSLRLRRQGSVGGPVSFQEMGPEYLTGSVRWLMRVGGPSPSQDNEFCQVMAVTGRQLVRVVSVRKQLDAAKIAASLVLAMEHSSNMVGES